jgi:hypothetical protein
VLWAQYLFTALDEWRLVEVELNGGVELDAAEWRAAPVEKVASAVESAVMGRWPGGEEVWQVAAPVYGGETGRWLVRRVGEWPRRHAVDAKTQYVEEWTTGSRADMARYEWMSAYASEEC